MLSKAIEIAAKAHRNQTDKGGSPYILHPMRVMLNFCGDEEEAVKICAVLHDVVEDTDVTLDDLRAEGFSEEIIAALDCLTKRKNENYDEFISRVLTNEIACRVKNGDLADNMDLTRIPNPTKKDIERVKKYSAAADRIMEAFSYGDEISECRLIEISGVAEIHPAVFVTQFGDMFCRFIESHGWFFSGSYMDVTNAAQEEQEET